MTSCSPRRHEETLFPGMKWVYGDYEAYPSGLYGPDVLNEGPREYHDFATVLYVPEC